MESTTPSFRPSLWLASLALLCLFAAAPASRVVKLTGEDFGFSADAKTITLKAGKNQMLHISHIYAEKIILMPADTNTAYTKRWAANRQGVEGSRSDYVFTLDISHLPAGAYKLHSTACYYHGQLNLELK